ncbi:MAG: PDZ domain-containing protein [Planctomycetales bacterium]|nr:PDZ domain-containing protein [Planctomycetales bacterium]
MRILLVHFLSLLVVSLLVLKAPAQDRNALVNNDRARVMDDGFWIYNDVAKGKQKAVELDKPLLVVFRCIPCEACAQLDEQVVENNPQLRKQLSQFVCVRVVHTNGMDMSQFQFDYDQSWAAFFLHADGTVLGRYGTRSHQTESSEDVSLDGFIASMNKAVQLFKRYPEVKEVLQAKLGTPKPFAHPEDLPSLKSTGRFASSLNYGPEVARSCIHCHQVGDAWHELFWNKPEPMPIELIYQYPHPKILGLIVDPGTATGVREVTPDSWAADAGFRSGDEIVSMQNQPLVSLADMQWVLHQASNDAQTIPVMVSRNGQPLTLQLKIPQSWKETGDISWRVSSWPFRRMVFGGLRLRSLSTEETRALNGLSAGVGLKVQHVGQFNEHATAKRAGFKVDDVITGVDGLSNPFTESQLFAHLLQCKKPGDQVTFEVLRDGKPRQISIPIQK